MDLFLSTRFYHAIRQIFHSYLSHKNMFKNQKVSASVNNSVNRLINLKYPDLIGALTYEHKGEKHDEDIFVDFLIFSLYDETGEC